MHIIQIVGDFISTSPNWTISTGAGAVLGGFLTDLPKVVAYPFRRFKRHWLCGEWFHYFANKDREVVHFVEEVMTIKRGFKNAFVFARSPASEDKSRYRGHIEFEKGFCLLKCKSTTEDEQLFQRFRITALNDRHTMVGLCCSQDYDGRASVNSCVISRTRLSEADFFAIVRSRIATDPKSRTMSVKS